MSKKRAKKKPAAAHKPETRAAERPRMTGAELKELLEHHTYSQSAMAREIGINDRTIRKHIASELVPVFIAYAVQWAIHIRKHGVG